MSPLTKPRAEFSKWRPTLRELTLFGVLAGLTFAMKVAMAGLPNIEPVSLMVMLFGVTFGRKAVYPVYVYVMMEFLMYGLNLWSLPYLYVWPLLAFLAWLMRESESHILWAVLSGGFGLCFGALCTPVCFVTGGAAYAFSWWVSGIPYDLLHCGGNFIIALVLFPTLRSLMEKLYGRMKKQERPDTTS